MLEDQYMKHSEFLDTILENVHLQPFIGYSRFITNHLVSLYKYECCIINCYISGACPGGGASGLPPPP